MAFDYVSEVDRNFYSNNLLSNDDFGTEDMDLSDFLGCDATLTAEDLATSFPDDFQIALDGGSLGTLDEQKLQDELLQEFSDSSDSGISGVMGQYSNTPSPDALVKQEPLSPASSFSSESSDLASPQILQDDIITIKTESPPASPITFPSVQGHIQTVQQSFTPVSHPTENISPIVIGGNGVFPGIAAPPVNINSILNSKVKIQPKPVSNTNSKQKQMATKTDAGKPLVLTAEEFNRLTSQGVLKFEPPQQTTAKVEISKVTPVVSTQPPAVPTSPILQADTEIKSLKRQQRMIKNRESASLSRKRKKEYLSTIEDQLKEFTLQNQKLKQENDLLRQRLNMIQNENEELKRGISFPPAAKKICLLSVLLFFCLNLGSFSDILFPSRSYSSSPLPDHVVHKGRQLMSLEENKNYTISSFLPDFQHNKLRKFMEENSRDFQGMDNKTLFDFYTCSTYFNKTESLRLADQLSGWMYRHEQQKKKKQRKRNQQPSKVPNHIQYAGRADLGSVKEQRKRWRDQKKYQMQIFQGDTVKDFWKSLPRRNDTFYVLSFNTDYFLVPATAHNKTMRPRMSLVMPATTLNETMQPPAGNIGMMQIDCEVLNTQLIHVHKSSLPKNVWPRNSTNPTNEEDSFP